MGPGTSSTGERSPPSVILSRFKSEPELVAAAARGDGRALEQLVEVFTPHIAGIARIYRNNRAVERAELMQAGVVGLLRALGRYDASRGTPFWPYASWWVRQSMQHLVAEMSRQVVLSDRALRRLSRIKDAWSAWVRTHGREPTVRELVDACGCRRKDLESLLAAELPARGLGEPVGGSAGDRGSATLAERVADETSGDAYEAVADRTRLEGLRGRCAELPQRERRVVYEHYGLVGRARTLREIAGELSLSVERVRQIEEVALKRLRDAIDSERGSAGDRRPALVLRLVDPGDSPSALRASLTRELAGEHCGASVTRSLVTATHEITAGIWLRGRPPRRIRVGRRNGAAVCEVSDPAAGPTSRASAAIVVGQTSRIDRIGARNAGCFRLWALSRS